MIGRILTKGRQAYERPQNWLGNNYTVPCLRYRRPSQSLWVLLRWRDLVAHAKRSSGENPHGLPSEVGILGVAVSIDDFSADDIWFQTNEHGEYKKDLKHRIYAASLIRWGEGNYAIMNEGSIDVINPAHGSTKSIPTGVNAFGMMSGVQSENGTHLLLKTFSEESADRLLL